MIPVRRATIEVHFTITLTIPLVAFFIPKMDEEDAYIT